MVDEPRVFEVIFRDAAAESRRKVNRFEAETAREAAEIVAKLAHLMLMQGGSRTQRLADTDAPTCAAPTTTSGGTLASGGWVGGRRVSM